MSLALVFWRPAASISFPFDGFRRAIEEHGIHSLTSFQVKLYAKRRRNEGIDSTVWVASFRIYTVDLIEQQKLDIINPIKPKGGRIAKENVQNGIR
jgi:hypothetical protein